MEEDFKRPFNVFQRCSPGTLSRENLRNGPGKGFPGYSSPFIPFPPRFKKQGDIA